MHIPVGGLGVEGTEVLLLQVIHSSRGGPLLTHRAIPGANLLFRKQATSHKMLSVGEHLQVYCGARPCDDFKTDHNNSAYVNT